MQLASPSVRFKRHSSFHAVSIVGASFAACTDTSFCSTASFEKVCMFVRVNKEAVRSVLTHSQMKAAALLLGCVCVCVCVTESKLCGVHSPSVRYKIGLCVCVCVSLRANFVACTHHQHYIWAVCVCH